MYSPLPAWSGNVVAILHRCDITREELAKRSGISCTYLSTLLHDHYPSETTCRKVDKGLRECLEKRGMQFVSLLAIEERPD